MLRPPLGRAGSAAPDPDLTRRSREIKALVRSRLALEPDAVVVVQELACREPGCPPVETVVAVLAPGCAPRQATLHRPLREVSTDDVGAVLAQLAAPTGGTTP